MFVGSKNSEFQRNEIGLCTTANPVVFALSRSTANPFASQGPICTGCTGPFKLTKPVVGAEVEAALCEGASLTQFIDREQSEFVNRGEAAIERWKREGGGHLVDEVMAKLQARFDDAMRLAAAKRTRR